MADKGITSREEDFSQWYLDIIERAELAENSAVRGCMVIKPYGYAIWENIQKELDRRIKASGHKNAYFPLLIPKSFFTKEASHVKGFAKECAVVTHYRLKESPDGKGIVVDEDAKLEEELIIRPTSETIIYDTFSRWITSWRDLPMKINQWANIMRWEKRTRPFLRTAEFLWQEGHTVYATEEENIKEVKDMLQMYVDFAREILAVETYSGRKSESEKFAGAVNTFGVEAMMPDGKSLQFGTSHDLGQNFAKAFEIKFADKDGTVKTPYQNSWGVSTRMMGALIMTHSDANGLVLPPMVAPIKIIIVPISKDENRETVMEYCNNIVEELKTEIEEVELDARDFVSPGYKFNEWEKKGVPVRMEIGERDIQNGGVTMVRRDTNEKMFVERSQVLEYTKNLLNEIQNSLLNRSQSIIRNNTHTVESYEELKTMMKGEKGYAKVYWCGDPKCEESIKAETKATTRCIAEEDVSGKCIYCGKDSKEVWYIAQSY
jgi:prolyl-tRNA synthetase